MPNLRLAFLLQECSSFVPYRHVGRDIRNSPLGVCRECDKLLKSLPSARIGRDRQREQFADEALPSSFQAGLFTV